MSGRQAVLAQGALGLLAHHPEGVGVLSRAGLVDQVDDLDRPLEPDPARHVEEGAAGPERGGGGGELALLVGEPPHVPALDELRVLLHRPLERREDDALLDGGRLEPGPHHAGPRWTINPESPAHAPPAPRPRASAICHCHLPLRQHRGHDLRQLIGSLTAS